MIGKQGMQNMVFEIEDVLDESDSLDIWVIHYSEPELDQCFNLKTLLWDISFNPSKVVKNYEITHSVFYKMLM
jgi:hypothetical protein